MDSQMPVRGHDVVVVPLRRHSISFVLYQVLDGLAATSQIRDMGYWYPIVGVVRWVGYMDVLVLLLSLICLTLFCHQSGNALLEQKQQFLLSGVDAVITKPIRFQQLVRIFENYNMEPHRNKRPRLQSMTTKKRDEA
jgi:CheY-like chemotaxis protein